MQFSEPHSPTQQQRANPLAGKRLLLVVNVDWFFLSHRVAIALRALQEGMEVHVATGITSHEARLRALGFVVHPLTVARSSMRLRGECASFVQLLGVFRRVRPDLAHLVTIKPVLFGGIAARLVGTPAVLAAVPGLGTMFLAAGWRAGLMRRMLLFFYRVALRKRGLIAVFQNRDDAQLIQNAAHLADGQCTLIPGSGVDLERFRAHPLPAGAPLVVLAARLLADKGVREFVAAAAQLRAEGVDARFCLVGTPDAENLTSIPAEEIARWQAQGVVEVWGHREDMPEVLRLAHIVVLPSYREGLPKVLSEAAACGRAVVTCDVPGCRDAIVPGATGLLVPPADVPALAEAIGRLLRDPDACARMGGEGRRLAEQRFGLDSIVGAHLQLYRRLLEPGS